MTKDENDTLTLNIDPESLIRYLCTEHVNNGEADETTS